MMPSERTYTLAPSFPAPSWDALYTLWAAFLGTLPEIQVDIVDGTFAPHTSWPFTEPEGVSALTRLRECAPTRIEIDAMCMHPEQHLDLFLSVGATRVVIHAGSTEEYHTCLTHRTEHGYRMGLGILNTTPSEFLHEWIPHFDYVQVMGIETIGAQGLPFDERTLETVAQLRETYPELEIAVDGAVNASTIPRLIDAGANRFLPGSVIVRSPHPEEAYKQLLKLLPY